jgi:BirA family biotin operon repressor/biotin-[acetyl-CoA-carboxylase] ligase
MAVEILRALKKNGKGSPDSFIPGPALSGTLGITRAAVWKKISRLRKSGYVIRGGKQGYKLISAPELSLEELKLLIPDTNIIYRSKTVSTNLLALNWLVNPENGLVSPAKGLVRPAKGLVSPLLVVADAQSGGRGRFDRRWVSPAGINVYMSVVLRPELPPRKAPLLSLVCALACATAIKACSGLEAGLKWPNDLMAGGRKLGGILLELRSDPDRISFAVAGIGINVNAGKSDFPRSLRGSATSILLETGVRVNRAVLIAALYGELHSWLKLLYGVRGAGLNPVLKAYRALSVTISRKVKILSEDIEYEGTAADIDEEGSLLLKTEKRTLRFSTGQVFSLRQKTR